MGLTSRSDAEIAINEAKKVLEGVPFDPDEEGVIIFDNTNIPTMTAPKNFILLLAAITIGVQLRAQENAATSKINGIDRTNTTPSTSNTFGVSGIGNWGAMLTLAYRVAAK